MPFGEAMRRRDFIKAVAGSVAASPLAAHAQQRAMPVVGLLSSDVPDLLQAFRQGLKETGFIEHENIAIEYREPQNQISRLSELAADLIRLKVDVIVAGNTASALAVKAATATIPVVFNTPGDPVALGIVTNLARPEGNLTGITWLAGELSAKRLELLHEVTPGAARIALLVEPNTGAITQTIVKDVVAAARPMGLQIRVLEANTSAEIDAAFATIARERLDALFVGNSPLFNSRRIQVVNLASYHRIPATYSGRIYPEIGGLMSYGASVTDAFRQVGVYTGRILKGARPADLPVLQSTKLELVINHQSARMLNLSIPDKLLVAADEVIE